jgi:hypothetical protein
MELEPKVYLSCILLACFIILMSVFVYRVLINYKKFCESHSWLDALVYVLSIIVYSLLNGFLIYQAINLFHSVWITL